MEFALASESSLEIPSQTCTEVYLIVDSRANDVDYQDEALT